MSLVNDLAGDFISNNLKHAKKFISVDPKEALAVCAEFYDAAGLPRVVPAIELQALTPDMRMTLMHIGGMYVWPTTELCVFIAGEVEGYNPVEICAGNGVLARTLGIPATDSFMQSPYFKPKTRTELITHQSALNAYKALNVPFVRYGVNVIQREAKDAVRQSGADLVYGLFVTHKTTAAGGNGNMLGVDEDWIYSRNKIKKYMVVGNKETHKDKPLLNKKHNAVFLDGLVTRSVNQDENRIFIWTK